jgi:hypothetical protein
VNPPSPSAVLLRDAAGGAGILDVLDVTADVEIQIAVVVEVAPGYAGPVAREGGKVGIALQPAAVVAEQDQGLVAADHQIEPAVRVDIAPRRAHPLDPGLGEVLDAAKAPVAEVFVELRGRPLRIRQGQRAAGADQKEVVVAVVVEIAPRRAGAHVLGQL